jgi:Uma2 family endonuclease
MIATLRPLTYDDLRDMPADGQRREVLEGELIVNPAPRRDHQETVANLDWILQRFLRASGGGRVYTHPVDLYLGRHDIVQPDLVVIRDSRLGIYQPEGIIDEPPDIVVEILSRARAESISSTRWRSTPARVCRSTGLQIPSGEYWL